MSKGITIPIDTCAVIGMQVATEKAIARILKELICSDVELSTEQKLNSIHLFAIELEEGKVNYE